MAASRMQELRFCFNPTLVRLRPSRSGSLEANHDEFQSHAGSIEAAGAQVRAIYVSQFQSHAGSIEAGRKLVCHVPSSKVSIPRWFD